MSSQSANETFRFTIALLVSKIDSNTAVIALTFPYKSRTLDHLTVPPTALGGLIQSISKNMNLMAMRVMEARDLVENICNDLNMELSEAEAGEQERGQETIEAMNQLTETMRDWRTNGAGNCIEVNHWRQQ